MPGRRPGWTLGGIPGRAPGGNGRLVIMVPGMTGRAPGGGGRDGTMPPV